MTMTKKIKMKRMLNDLTQKDMAGKLGVHIGTYSKKENGLIAWSIEDVKKLRKILNLSDEEIIDIFFK